MQLCFVLKFFGVTPTLDLKNILKWEEYKKPRSLDISLMSTVSKASRLLASRSI